MFDLPDYEGDIVQSGVGHADVDYQKDSNALRLEAWWAVNPFPPTQASDDVSKKHWSKDVQPARPFHQAIKYSWEHTQRLYSVEPYRLTRPERTSS